MPWRLIIFILIFGILLTFIMFNLGEHYRCDINFGFKTFPQVPVFLTIFISFFLGLLCALPLSLIRKKNNVKPAKADSKTKSETDLNEESIHVDVESDEKIKQDAAEAKKRFFQKRKGR